MTNLQIEQTPIHTLRPHPHNARTHSKKQIRQIADSIRAVGFAAPVLIDEARRAARRSRPAGSRQTCWGSRQFRRSSSMA